VSVKAVPVLAGAREYLAKGFRPEGSVRNANTFRKRVELRVSEAEFTLMCDAQTSGGLLIAVSPANEQALEERFRESGLFYAKIGRVSDRDAVVTLID
jgi:selenide,water dikinase